VTIGNFWKMIICEDIELIVMLCNLQENGKVYPSLNKSLFYFSKEPMRALLAFWFKSLGVSLEFKRKTVESVLRK